MTRSSDMLKLCPTGKKYRISNYFFIFSSDFFFSPDNWKQANLFLFFFLRQWGKTPCRSSSSVKYNFSGLRNANSEKLLLQNFHGLEHSHPCFSFLIILFGSVKYVYFVTIFDFCYLLVHSPPQGA